MSGSPYSPQQAPTLRRALSVTRTVLWIREQAQSAPDQHFSPGEHPGQMALAIVNAHQLSGNQQPRRETAQTIPLNLAEFWDQRRPFGEALAGTALQGH